MADIRRTSWAAARSAT